MSAGGAAMPELGSKISLISKADIRYEGRLFTVDPQECTIALSNVRSFGTEDRECSFPVSPQNQIYDYILFRGSDIKDIRVVNTVNPVPNDPAIVTLSVPQPLANSGFQAAPAPPSAQPAPVFGGSNMLGPMRPSVPPFGASYNSVAANLSSGLGLSHQDSAKILSNLMSGRAMTPVNSRKSPTMDQSTQSDHSQKMHQIGAVGSRGQHRQGDNQRGRGAPRGWHHRQDDNRGDNEGRGGWGGQQNNQRGQWRGMRRGRGGQRSLNEETFGQAAANYGGRGASNYGRGGGGFGRGGQQHQGGQGGQQQQQMQGGANAQNQQKRNVLKFEGDFDFEQANTEFENLRSQLAKIKITATAAGSSNVGIKMATLSDVTPGPLKAQLNGGDTPEIKEKEPQQPQPSPQQPPIENEDDNGEIFYDKQVSFFDNISCEAIERSKGCSQRTDWRQERKLNSETFGVSAARRGYRGGRGGYYRGGGGNQGYRGNYNNRGGYRGNRGGYNNQRNNHHQQQGQQGGQGGQQQQPQPVGAQRGGGRQQN